MNDLYGSSGSLAKGRSTTTTCCCCFCALSIIIAALRGRSKMGCGVGGKGTERSSTKRMDYFIK